MDFFKRYFNKDTTLYISDPTWPTHTKMARLVGVNHKTYRYYDYKTISIDYEGLMEDVRNAPDESVFLL